MLSTFNSNGILRQFEGFKRLLKTKVISFDKNERLHRNLLYYIALPDYNIRNHHLGCSYIEDKVLLESTYKQEELKCHMSKFYYFLTLILTYLKSMVRI